MKALDILIRSIFLEERLLGLNSTVKLEVKSILIRYNQHILRVTRVQFFIMHYSLYYKCTSWHIQAMHLCIQGSLHFTVSILSFILSIKLQIRFFSHFNCRKAIDKNML